MKTSQNGIELIKKYEGFSAIPYLCPGDEWTIGYGHKILPGESFNRISKKVATELLAHDVGIAERFIRGRGWALTQNEFDALVSFVYNVGIGTFKKSSVMKYINQGNKKLAALYILVYTKSGGVVLPGLVKRREDEHRLFISSNEGDS